MRGASSASIRRSGGRIHVSFASERPSRTVRSLVFASNVAALDSLVTVSGDRYGAEQMKHLDSERHAHP